MSTSIIKRKIWKTKAVLYEANNMLDTGKESYKESEEVNIDSENGRKLNNSTNLRI